MGRPHRFPKRVSRILGATGALIKAQTQVRPLGFEICLCQSVTVWSRVMTPEGWHSIIYTMKFPDINLMKWQWMLKYHLPTWGHSSVAEHLPSLHGALRFKLWHHQERKPSNICHILIQSFKAHSMRILKKSTKQRFCLAGRLFILNYMFSQLK